MKAKNEEKKTFTFQTRLQIDDDASQVLDEYALQFCKIERSLFADIAAKKDSLKLKNEYLKRFNITARQYNSCRIQVLGKIASIKERLPGIIKELNDKIVSLEKKIAILQKKKREFEVHQKKRRLIRLKAKRDRLKDDLENENFRLCFGGKKLFRAQFALEKNGYQSPEKWKEAWRKARSSDFFVVGSKDETAGNQSCALTYVKEGVFELRLRLLNGLTDRCGKYIKISQLKFKYGHNAIFASLESCLARKQGFLIKNAGKAISYRFKKDKKGWILYVTTDMEKPKIVTNRELGALGVDINENHLAIVEIDRFGNPIAKKTISLNTYGKTKNQTLALIGECSAKIVEWAKKVKKPIVLEDLNFQKKKAALKEMGFTKFNRMLSGLAYNKIIEILKSKAFREGVETYTVNPAFTSIIGYKFAKKYGLSKHHAAGLCIARRKMGFSEQPPKSSLIILDGKEDQLTLPLPVRNRSKHVWSFWKLVGKKIRTALVAHFRAMYNRSLDPPSVNPSDSLIPGIVDEISARESLAALLG